MGELDVCKMCLEAEILNEDKICQSCSHEGNFTDKKLFSEETVKVDSCQCVYCGHIFGGRRACNADMDCTSVTCPECEKEMNVTISVEYTCTPLEGED